MTPSANPKLLIRTAALLGFTAVLFGAFGAHGLKTKIAPEMMAAFETGCRYHLAHALALLALTGLISLVEERTLFWVVRCWILGIVVFSGSLYALAITGVRLWGMLTPVGGLFLMAGWLSLFGGVTPQADQKKKN